jgi:hypothetical protein
MLSEGRKFFKQKNLSGTPLWRKGRNTFVDDLWWSEWSAVPVISKTGADGPKNWNPELQVTSYAGTEPTGGFVMLHGPLRRLACILGL